jgi:hypothetical protein
MVLDKPFEMEELDQTIEKLFCEIHTSRLDQWPLSQSIGRIWVLSFDIVVCIAIGVIASNALAARATLA